MSLFSGAHFLSRIVNPCAFLFCNSACFNGMLECRTLWENGIQDGSVLTLSRSVPGGMQIHLTTLTDKVLSFEVDGSDTVEVVKRMLQDQTGIPPDQARLLYSRKQLEDHRTLAEYGIEHEAKIQLILRLRGSQE